MSADLIREIESKKKDMSKGQRQIADFILNNYEQAAYMTTVNLGRSARVSESSVVRFAHFMGYSGYPKFHQALQETVRNRLTAFQRVAVSNLLIGDSEVLEKVLISDQQKIKQTLDETKRESFNRVVNMLVEAKTVYVIGVRASSMLAQFLTLNLRMIFNNVRAIDVSSGGDVFEQLLPMEKGDLLFAISFPRYSSRVVKAVKYAQQAGVTVVSLTDNPMSPIAKGADEVLYAQSDMASFVDSLVAPLSLINAILVAISKKCPEQVSERLLRLEQIWDEYEVYDKDRH
ncbi:MAG: MurR/RpiR family transcriptional regulator [Clostridia bacterium]|nr:MurR/RpiR family transcriptional regulator [Clostridia bacterium]